MNMNNNRINDEKDYVDYSYLANITDPCFVGSWPIVFQDFCTRLFCVAVMGPSGTTSAMGSVTTLKRTAHASRTSDVNEEGPTPSLTACRNASPVGYRMRKWLDNLKNIYKQKIHTIRRKQTNLLGNVCSNIPHKRVIVNYGNCPLFGNFDTK